MIKAKALITLSLLVWALLLICGPRALAEQPLGARSLSKADEAAIRQLLKEQETAWNKHDMKAFTKALRDDAEGINVAGMYWSGKEAIVKHLVEFHASFLKDCEEYIDEMQIHSIDDGHAIVVSIWRVSAFKGPGGNVIPACRHRDTSVLVREGGEWRVVHFHNTTIDEGKIAAAETPAKK